MESYGATEGGGNRHLTIAPGGCARGLEQALREYRFLQQAC